MGKQAQLKAQRRAEAALENAMGVVDEALQDGGIYMHILQTQTGRYDAFSLIYMPQFEAPIDKLLDVLKRVVIGELESREYDDPNGVLWQFIIPVHYVQAGGPTLGKTFWVEIDTSKIDE